MILTGTVPIFEAIASYFRRMIHNGALLPGAALPSVREVAETEGINPNTVARAYGTLVGEGLIVALPKKGYFVAGDQTAKHQDHLDAAINALIGEGYTPQEIIESAKRMKGGRDD